MTSQFILVVYFIVIIVKLL